LMDGLFLPGAEGEVDGHELDLSFSS